MLFQSPYGDLVSGKVENFLTEVENQPRFQSPYGDLVSGKFAGLKFFGRTVLFQSPYGDLVSGKPLRRRSLKKTG